MGDLGIPLTWKGALGREIKGGAWQDSCCPLTMELAPRARAGRRPLPGDSPSPDVRLNRDSTRPTPAHGKGLWGGAWQDGC